MRNPTRRIKKQEIHSFRCFACGDVQAIEQNKIQAVRAAAWPRPRLFHLGPSTIIDAYGCNHMETAMTTSDAEKYVRRAQVAGDLGEMGSAVKHAVDALVRTIRDLEARASRLESKMQ
jgi:hypothetical protein